MLIISYLLSVDKSYTKFCFSKFLFKNIARKLLGTIFFPNASIFPLILTCITDEKAFFSPTVSNAL